MTDSPRPPRPRRPGKGPRAAMSGSMAGAHGARLKPTAAPAAAPSGDSSAPAAARSRPGARGFLHAAALAERPLREASAQRGFAEARVLTDWPAIAGEALSAVCTPLKVSYSGKSFGATLIVQAEGARAAEVEMTGPRLVERVNAHYGYRAVARVKVVQTGRRAPAGLAEAAPGFARRPAADPDRAPVAAAPEIDGVSDPGLRAALERLGRRVSARKPTAS